VPLMVGTEFSADKFPGFLNLPYNFEFEAIEKFYKAHKQVVLSHMQQMRHPLQVNRRPQVNPST
jgi:hypothetical protein